MLGKGSEVKKSEEKKHTNVSFALTRMYAQ